MTSIGIDPGLKGAVAFLVDGQEPAVFDTPILTIRRGKGLRHEYEVAAMQRLLREHTVIRDGVTAALEAVHAFPGEGVASVFSLGRGLGLWEGILATLEIPYELVPPQRWKKLLMYGMGKEKGASRIVAGRLFPSVDLSLVKHHGRADALLIAEWMRRVSVGGAAGESVCG